MPAHVRAYVRLNRLYCSIWPGEVKVTEDGAARGNEFNDFEIGRVGNQIGIERPLPHAKPPGFRDLRQPRPTLMRDAALVSKVWERLLFAMLRVTFDDAMICIRFLKDRNFSLIYMR